MDVSKPHDPLKEWWAPSASPDSQSDRVTILYLFSTECERKKLPFQWPFLINIAQQGVGRLVVYCFFHFLF